MKSDAGYFGPTSMMWKVNKEITVLFGGARALINARSSSFNLPQAQDKHRFIKEIHGRD